MKIVVKILFKFSFSINEPYEKEVIGSGPYKTGSQYDLLPNFVGDSKEEAEQYAKAHGISITFVGTSGYVVTQSYPASTRMDLIKGSVTLTLSRSDNEKEKANTFRIFKLCMVTENALKI